MSTFEEILSAALALPPGMRAMLADHLLTSLDGPDQKRIDALWAEEAERRMKEIRDGKVQTIDGEQVIRELRARVTSEQPNFNRVDPAVLLEITSYGKLYRSKHLGGYDSDLLLKDWWSALEFFFAHIYYQGRRDAISDKVRAAVIEVCSPLFSGNNGRENFNQLRAAQWQPLEGKLRKKIGKGYVGKGGDIRMTLSALSFIGCIPDLNIVAHSVGRIRTGQIESHYTELQYSSNHQGEGIYQLGPKITSLYLRDLVWLYELDDKINRGFWALLQPVDVHVRRVASLIGLVEASADDRKIRNAIVEACLENSLPPLMFNQGAWFLSVNNPEKLIALTTDRRNRERVHA